VGLKSIAQLILWDGTIQSKLEDNIKIDHRVTECQSVDRNESAKDRVK